MFFGLLVDGEEGVIGGLGLRGWVISEGGGLGHGGGSVPFLGGGGYLGMRPLAKKLKCWLLPMMR